MPMYYFDVKDGTRLIDPTGLECRNDADAETKGRFIAQEIAKNAPHHLPRQVSILNEEGGEVSIVPIHPGER